ncbi:MAG: superoxide dismutase [Patescibacteria group bacterium]
MTFELPELPYQKDSFSDWTSAETFDFHYGKHHTGYVKKLNDAVAETEWTDKSLEEVISGNRDNPTIFNNAAQHFNHSFFWNCLSPETMTPDGKIAEMIDRDFGSFDEFKTQFSDASLKLFGSGWAWLVLNGDKLEIIQTSNADTPAGTDKTPLLTLDVWEHAYYIDFRNDRAKFIEGFWSHVNWKFVNKQLS